MHGSGTKMQLMRLVRGEPVPTYTASRPALAGALKTSPCTSVHTRHPLAAAGKEGFLGLGVS